jgi:hypothetical protein
MSLGLPPVVFDIGAPAERVRLYSKGAVIPVCSGGALLEALPCSIERLIHNDGNNSGARRRPRSEVTIISSTRDYAR